ncbi:MAG: hypothetical protein D6718_07285, partial [Acidobacteria bacterium]
AAAWARARRSRLALLALIAIPPCWLLCRLHPAAPGVLAGISPGRAVAAALVRALDGRGAWLPGAALALGTVGLTTAARLVPAGIAFPAAALRRKPSPALLAAARRLLGPVRARELAWHGAAGAALVLAAARAVRSAVPEGPALARAGVILAAWIAAGALAPLAANVLGWGGRAGAAVALLPAPGWRLLAEPLAAVGAAAGAAVAATAAAAAAAVDPPAALRAAAAGSGAVGAALGAGAVASVRWPRAASLGEAGGPLWGPDPARLILPLAQAMAFAPAAAGHGPLSLVVSPLLGMLAAAAGLRLAAARLDAARPAFTEALLR